MKSILLIGMIFLMGCVATGESVVTATLNKKAEENVWRIIREQPEFLIQQNSLADGASITYDEDYYKEFREILKPIATIKQYSFYGKKHLDSSDIRLSNNDLNLYGYGHILLSGDGKEVGEILTNAAGGVGQVFINPRLEWAGRYESGLKIYHQLILPHLTGKNIQVDEVRYGFPFIYIRLKQAIPVQLKLCTDPSGWVILDQSNDFRQGGNCGIPVRQFPVEH